ncbi:hypothetical protein ACFL2T_07380 [Elusimicrobiota bacterium]
MNTKMLSSLCVALCGALLMGCAGARHVKVPSKRRRPTLSYSPKSVPVRSAKYPLIVGVADLRDRRVWKFFGGKDKFFREPIIEGVSNALYNDLKASGLFSGAKRISADLPRKLTGPERLKLHTKHGVDMLLVTDLTKFNMRRIKAGVYLHDSFNILVDIAWVARLIHLDSGTVVWAGQIDRSGKESGASGVLNPGQLGRLTRDTMRKMGADMKMLIQRTGKRMASR